MTKPQIPSILCFTTGAQRCFASVFSGPLLWELGCCKFWFAEGARVGVEFCFYG